MSWCFHLIRIGLVVLLTLKTRKSYIFDPFVEFQIGSYAFCGVARECVASKCAIVQSTESVVRHCAKLYVELVEYRSGYFI